MDGENPNNNADQLTYIVVTVWLADRNESDRICVWKNRRFDSGDNSIDLLTQFVFTWMVDLRNANYLTYVQKETYERTVLLLDQELIS